MAEFLYGTTNCRRCIDCQRMVGDGKVSWRCYGDVGGYEKKKNISEGENPPRVAPEWCPTRHRVKRI